MSQYYECVVVISPYRCLVTVLITLCMPRRSSVQAMRRGQAVISNVSKTMPV